MRVHGCAGARARDCMIVADKALPASMASAVDGVCSMLIMAVMWFTSVACSAVCCLESAQLLNSATAAGEAVDLHRLLLWLSGSNTSATTVKDAPALAARPSGTGSPGSACRG